MARTSPKAFANISTGSPSTDGMQDRIAAALSSIAKCPLINGIEIEVDIVAGDNVIPHRLGRQIKGYSPMMVTSGPCTLYCRSADSKRLVLASDAPAHVKLWVY